ncbi:MAG: L,D-transpeptidase family protein [Phycisphaerae bacterium]|nr:L,D-transpeptidase family protein [Phycisphaerae bacterium]
MNTKNKRIVAVVVTVAAAAGVFLWITRGPSSPRARKQGPPVAAAPVAKAPTAGSHVSSTAARPRETAPTRPAPTTTPPPAPPQASGASDVTVQQGLALTEAGKLLEARSVLSRALLAGGLNEAEAEQARTAATRLAEETLLSPRFYEGDPYAFQYTFVSGDTLSRVERELKLHVPAQLILRVNGIAQGSAIRAGQSVKMIQGPFHAIVSKGNFTLDLYLHREGLEKLFIKRVRVGLGADGSTPVGSWKVGLGKKMINATWFPPASSPIRRPQRPGDPDYPLGNAGYWIGLVGTDPNTTSAEGYGLHGTNDPNSIGRAASLGCIRLADSDIEWVFAMLYEEWSTVQVTP